MVRVSEADKRFIRPVPEGSREKFMNFTIHTGLENYIRIHGNNAIYTIVPDYRV